jgi:hypothetical protein
VAMRRGLQAFVGSVAVLLGASPAPAQSPTCEAVKQLLAVADLMTLADGPLVVSHTSPLLGFINKRAPGRVIVPQTKDCSVNRTDYANAGHQLSYSCAIADADPSGRDHVRIVRDVNARLRPCLPGWRELEDFNEPRGVVPAFYTIDYTKGGRKVSIIRLLSRDGKSFSTTFNVTDKSDR